MLAFRGETDHTLEARERVSISAFHCVPELHVWCEPKDGLSRGTLCRDSYPDLSTLTRREVPSLNTLCLDDFLFRHCNLKTLHFGHPISVRTLVSVLIFIPVALSATPSTPLSYIERAWFLFSL